MSILEDNFECNRLYYYSVVAWIYNVSYINTCTYMRMCISTYIVYATTEQPVDMWTHTDVLTERLLFQSHYGTAGTRVKLAMRRFRRVAFKVWIKILEIIFFVRLRIPTHTSNILHSRCSIPQHKLTLSAGWSNRRSPFSQWKSRASRQTYYKSIRSADRDKEIPFQEKSALGHAHS